MRHFSLSWAIGIHSTPSHPLALTSIYYLLSFHQRLGLLTCLTFLGFSTRNLYEILIFDSTSGNTSFHLWEKDSYVLWDDCAAPCSMHLIDGFNKTGNVRINVTLRRVRVTTVAVEKQLMLHIVCVCLCVALGIQYAMCMHHIVICGLSGCTVFSYIISISGTIFGKKLPDTECVFWHSLQLLSETFLILRRNEWGIKLYRSFCTVPFILVRL